MDRLRLATFNTFNLQLHDQRFYEQVYDRSTYTRKVEWIRDQLERMRADVVIFQEVWSEKALADVAGDTYPELHLAEKGGEFPSVALASRLPLERVSAPHPDTNKRAFLRAELDWGFPMVIYGVHLKSKRPDFEPGEDRDDPVDWVRAEARSLARRAAEAAAVREWVLRDLADPGCGVVLLGDLNDTSASVTTRMITGPRPKGHEGKWRNYLHLCADIQLQRSYRDVYYTHIHEGFHESLDHVMVSDDLQRGNPRARAGVESVQMFNDHLGEGESPRDWQSDHGQVVVTLRRRREE